MWSEITDSNRGQKLGRLLCYHYTNLAHSVCVVQLWSRRLDSNQRPLGPKPSALPSCATPRHPLKTLFVPDDGFCTHAERV